MVAPPACPHPLILRGLIVTNENVLPASRETAAYTFDSWLYATTTVDPRAANTGLSASPARAARTTVQFCPKSMDLATTTSCFLFCSQAAYTVRRSAGSTTICGSYWAVPSGAISCGVSHV